MNARRIGLVLLGVTIIFGLAPLVLGAEDLPTAEHHLFHAILLVGASVAGVLCVTSARRVGTGAVGWLLLALLSPVVVMLLMWPSEYTYFETHRFGHALEHMGIIAFGFAAGFAGQRFAAGIGWAASISVVAMALLSVWGYGVSPAATTVAAVATTATAPVANGAPNLTHGASLFKQNCAACHGATGEGGVGPSLENESSRKSLTAAETWIEHPAPPMPTLYPSTLSAQDVVDVAGYVETLR